MILHGNDELLNLVLSERKKSPCLKTADLAVSGGELKDIGIEPRLIGGIMTHLLDLVISDPELNEKETLVSLAKKREKQINGENNV